MLERAKLLDYSHIYILKITYDFQRLNSNTADRSQCVYELLSTWQGSPLILLLPPFPYFDTWRVNFNINIEPVKHNCFLKKCHRNNTIIRYHRCCNFRLQIILRRFDLHYIKMNWYTLCYINIHNITKLKNSHFSWWQ